MDTLQEAILANKPATTEEALNVQTAEGTINDLIINATATIGEKISFRRVAVVEKQMMKSLVHTCTWVDQFLLL